MELNVEGENGSKYCSEAVSLPSAEQNQDGKLLHASLKSGHYCSPQKRKSIQQFDPHTKPDKQKSF